MGIFFALLSLGIVIFVHELGHMIAAKKSGIGVLEFSIGMGPKVVSKKINETLYSLRIFPFGGFVRLAGLDDDPENPCPDDQSFYKKSIFPRFLTIAAGSLVNVVFGFLVLLVLFSCIGVPQVSNTIDRVVPRSPAQIAGLDKGDKIIAINRTPVKDPMADIIHVIRKSKGSELTLTVVTRGETRDITTHAIENTKRKGNWILGIQMKSQPTRYAPVQALRHSTIETGRYIKMVFVNLNMLFTHKVSLKEMAGPVGIIQLANFEYQKGAIYFLNLMAMISISLGVMNLLPFPVLDGGHIVLLAIEGIRGKRLSPKWEGYINTAGMALLIALMAFIVMNDILHWSTRASILRSMSK